MRAIHDIAVIGAGLMGHGIAQEFAAAGYSVTLHDADPASLAAADARIRANLRALDRDEAAADRVTPVLDLAAAVADADFVVEAVAENLALKRSLFAAIENGAPADAVLASNTSSIPITEIAAGLTHRERVLATHWYDPPFLIPLVEVVGTEWTAPDILDGVIALHRAIGKTVVHVRSDIPGYIGNRLQAALWREAMALVQAGVCDAETVDTVAKASFGRRLAVLGPLENADLIGTDLTLAIHEVILPTLDRTPGPLPVLRELVAGGRLGVKTGAGFRDWTEDEVAALRARLFDHLKRGLQSTG